MTVDAGDFLDRLRDAGPLRMAGLQKRTSEGLRQAARMASKETWSNHLLQLRNDLRQALSHALTIPAGSWNAVAMRLAASVDGEIVPLMRRWAEDNGLDEAFVQDVRYAVMTAALGEAWRHHARIGGIDAVSEALLAGRLPCGFRNGALVSY